jgi:cell division protein FtsZ
VLLSIQGGSNLGILEINDAARLVQEAVHSEANIIFGAVIDDTLGDEVRVTVIAAGFDGEGNRARPAEVRRSTHVEAPRQPAPQQLSAPEPNQTGSHEWTVVAETTTLTQTSDLDGSYGDDEDDLDIPEFLR